jgi:LPS sulfotransferase NodH
MSQSRVARFLCACIGADQLRRPLHIVQPNPLAPLDPEADVDVPWRFLLLVRIWHCAAVQAVILLVYRLWLALRGGPRPVRFVLLAMPRSGSTAIVHALNGHPSIACAGEILNPLYRVYGDVSPPASRFRRALHIDAILSGLTAALGIGTPAPASAVGFKVLDEQLVLHAYASRESEASLCELRRGCSVLSGDPAPRVILLARQDLGQAYASRKRAHRSGVWYDDSGVQQDETKEESAEESGDEEDALEYAAWTRSVWRDLEEEMAAQSVDALRVYFEDFLRCPETALCRIVHHLGLTPPEPGVLAAMAALAGRSAPTTRTRRRAEAVPLARRECRGSPLGCMDFAFLTNALPATPSDASVRSAGARVRAACSSSC